MKKEGKIEKVHRLSQEGANVKEIAEKMKLNEKIVRAYVWRAKNPEKYKTLLNRYYEKKKGKEVPTTKAEGKPVEAQKKERKSQQT